jgi:hypothetical protein
VHLIGEIAHLQEFAHISWLHAPRMQSIVDTSPDLTHLWIAGHAKGPAKAGPHASNLPVSETSTVERASQQRR